MIDREWDGMQRDTYLHVWSNCTATVAAGDSFWAVLAAGESWASQSYLPCEPGSSGII